jgi:pyruvate formate lyase activating enzyme
MLDWEGKLALSLFVGGCNFRCPYCHNPELVLKTDELMTVPWEEIEEHLRNREGWLEGVVIGGGEPTLHPDLPYFLKRVKSLSYQVKLDTNGAFPQHLQELINQSLVDYVAMDIKASWPNYPRVVNSLVDVGKVKKSLDILRQSPIDYEFRTTVVPGFVDRKDIISIAKELAGARLYVLQQFNPHQTLDESLRDLAPYPHETIKKWAEEANDFVPTRLRGAG